MLTLFIACSSDDHKKEEESNGNSEQLTIKRAIFTDPLKINNKESDTNIMASLIDYIDHTPENEVIHISIYLFSYQPLLNALKKANDRGVEIHALIDYSREGTSNPGNDLAISYLQGILESPSEASKFISEITTTSIDHDKYVLFSEIDLPDGIAKNVVFATSHNFTLAGTKKIQDALAIGNAKLYNAFLANWEEIKKRADKKMKGYEYTESQIDENFKVDFFPRRKNGEWDGKDNYIEILDKVKDYSKAEVRVVMSDWSRTNVAEKLVELQKNGFQVKVITKDKSGNSAALSILQDLEKVGGELNVVPLAKANTHSKFVLIKGEINGEQRAMLYTGSHNFTYNALKNNNEVLFELKNDELFEDYWEFFDELEAKLIFK